MVDTLLKAILAVMIFLLLILSIVLNWTTPQTVDEIYEMPNAANPYNAYHIQYDTESNIYYIDTEHADIGRYGKNNPITHARVFLPINTSIFKSELKNATLRFRIDEDDGIVSQDFKIILYTNISFNHDWTFCKKNMEICWNMTEQPSTEIGTVKITEEKKHYYMDITKELNLDRTDGVMNIWLKSNKEDFLNHTEIEYVTIDSTPENPRIDYIKLI